MAYYPPPQPEKGVSGLAIAALCTCWIPVVGLVFSIIGLLQTGAGKLKGRGLAITALVLSVLFTAGGVWAGVLIGSKTSALDPGCTQGKPAIIDGSKKVTTDAAAGNATAVQADVQSIVTQLNAAVASSKRADVKTAMQAVSDDYNALLQGMTSGNLDATSLQTKLETDLQQVDNLCTIKVS
jgi:hypothetical protein